MALFMGVAPAIDIAWQLLKRDTHPGSLSAYRQMIEGLGDDLPMEQRMAQELGEKLSPEQLRMRPPSVSTITNGQFTDNVEHLPDIPILNDRDELHAEGNNNQDEFLDMFSKPSIRNENVGGPPAALDSFVDAMRNEKVDLMREYDDVPDELIQDAQEIDEPVFADDIHDYLDESDYENVPYYAGLQGKPMRRTYTPNMMEREEMPTFAGTPFNEETGFTRSEPMDLAMRLLKRQTTLPNFDMGLDETTGYQGVVPVQQVSAQPSQYSDAYLQGQYPDEFWSAVGSDPEITRGHGGSRHRADEQGNYLAVGVRGRQPMGDLPTRGPYRPRKGRAGYPQDMGVRVIPSGDMPEPEQIVTMPMRGGN